MNTAAAASRPSPPQAAEVDDAAIAREGVGAGHDDGVDPAIREELAQDSLLRHAARWSEKMHRERADGAGGPRRDSLGVHDEARGGERHGGGGHRGDLPTVKRGKRVPPRPPCCGLGWCRHPKHPLET